MHPHDIDVIDDGSIILLCPTTRRSEAWLREHAPDDAGWMGHNLGVERRYSEDWIVRWMVACSEDEPTTDQRAFDEYDRAMRDAADAWVIAGAGTETPYIDEDGRPCQRVFNPAKKKHGTLVIENDIVEEDD